MDKQENMDQVKRMDDGVKVNVSRDGKWIIIRSPKLEQPIIKPCAYFAKILSQALKKSYYNAEQIKQ